MESLLAHFKQRNVIADETQSGPVQGQYARVLRLARAAFCRARCARADARADAAADARADATTNSCTNTAADASANTAANASANTVANAATNSFADARLFVARIQHICQCSSDIDTGGQRRRSAVCEPAPDVCRPSDLQRVRTSELSLVRRCQCRIGQRRRMCRGARHVWSTGALDWPTHAVPSIR